MGLIIDAVFWTVALAVIAAVAAIGIRRVME
jgi:hypothetical protein